MLRFSLFGIPVQVQPWFWLSLGLIGVLSFDPTDGSRMFILVLFMLAGFLSIMIHELGHALTGRLFGAPTAITLQAFGGFASFPARAFTRPQDFCVTFAGPAVQFAFGCVAWVINALLIDSLTHAAIFFDLFTLISIFWALINLVPVYPLDGGRLVQSVLGPTRHALALKISIATALIFAAGLFLFTHSFIFPAFLGLMAHQNWQELKAYQSRF